MNDKKLLELSAKAAGIEVRHINDPEYGDSFDLDGEEWNPLTDDGDALRLAVKLKIELYYTHAYVVARGTDDHNPVDMYNNDPYAATRRAIVRAAAEIGKEMK